MSSFEQQFSQFSYLYGKPQVSGVIRQNPHDFIVEEILDFDLTGEGEHVCLFIEKTGENTQYIAKQLAKFADVKARDVSYAGLKDRNAVTRQWFSVPYPIKKELDWNEFSSDTIKVLKIVRHQKKLRIGCLLGNSFTLTIRDIDQVDELITRFDSIKLKGVPNYFGEQRFGIGGNNLALAERMFNGEQIRDKKLRGLVISAARSWLFNHIVSDRIAQSKFSTALAGDTFMFPVNNSFFTEVLNDSIQQRLRNEEICLSAPMIGNEDAFALETAGEFERNAIANFDAWLPGLTALKLSNDRRRMTLKPVNLQYSKNDDSTVTLSFILPAGSFATSILREAINYSDYTDVLRAQKREQ